MNILSLYSGVLGLDRAFHWHGFKTVAACDASAYCRWVCGHYLPSVPIYESDEEMTSERLRRDGIDPDSISGVIGGPPCQPSSVAGRRLGAADSRWRWPEAVRVVGDVRPRWFVFEQPTGIVSLAMPDGSRPFLTIVAALAALGYRVGYDRWPASAVGAPHGRMRVAVIGIRADVADAYGAQRWPRPQGRDVTDGDDARRQEAAGGPPSCDSHDGGGALAHANGDEPQRRRESGIVARAQGAADGDAQERQWDGDTAGDSGTVARAVGVGLADADGAGSPEHIQRSGQGGGERTPSLRSGRGVGLADAPCRGLPPRRPEPAWQQGRPDADKRGAPTSRVMGDAQGVAPGEPHQEVDAIAAQREARTLLVGPSARDLARNGSQGESHAQSALGRITDGFPRGLAHLWPAGRGREQYPWEPPRLVARPPKGTAASLVAEAELEALGNAVVSQQFEPVAAAMAALEAALGGAA